MALDATMASNLPGGESIARKTLGRLNIGLQPPRSPVAYPDEAPAAACISIDFDANSPERETWNHQGTYALVELSERFDVPLTWAICGKDADRDVDAYAKLKHSSVKPEIGVHTYSHIDVSKSTPELLEEEITRCIEVLGLSERPKTFVFPWNREAHFPVLAKMGFVAYRAQKRVISSPLRMNGLWNIPPVYYVDQKSLGAEALIKRYLDVCIHYRSVFHLWMHPWSIVVDGDADTMARKTLEPVFAYLKEKRDAGMLSTTTMGALANAREPDVRVASMGQSRT